MSLFYNNDFFQCIRHVTAIFRGVRRVALLIARLFHVTLKKDGEKRVVENRCACCDEGIYCTLNLLAINTLELMFLDACTCTFNYSSCTCDTGVL